MSFQLQDQSTDKSLRVLASKLRDFPAETREMLKTAEINYDEIEALPDSAFACPHSRRFPIHNADQTLLSQVYASGEKLPQHIVANLEKAAELYDVKINVLEKTASEEIDPSYYLLPEQKFGLMTSPTLVKEACEFFQNNYKKMDLNTRAQAACSLVKQAHAQKVKIPLPIYKYAGLTESNPRHISEWLEVRSGMASEPTIKNSFAKLASFVKSPDFKVATRQDLMKLATTVAALDEKASLVKKYDLTLPDPMATVFNTTKIASASIPLAGKQVSITKLAAIDAQRYGDILGKDIVPEISDKHGNIKEAELLDVLRSLPVDLQTALVTTLKL